MMQEKTFRKHVAKIKVPEGFTSAFSEEKGWGLKPSRWLVFVLLKDGDIKLEFRQDGSGCTSFKTDRGWANFERTGVESSFYHSPMWSGDKTKYDLNQIVAEQLERISKKREYYKTAVSIPGVPFTVAPDRVQQLKEQLRKVGHISFTPSGFGTGYVVGKRKRFQYDKRATPQMEEFFGLSPLYISTMDCD